MIEFVLKDSDGLYTGFSCAAHAGIDDDDFEGNLVCAAVSSVCYFAANTITDVCLAESELECDDGFISLKVKTPSAEINTILEGLSLHMNELANQYPDRIKINTTNVSP